MTANPLTPEMIQAAIAGLTARQETTAQQIAHLRAMLGETTANGDAEVISISSAAPIKKKRMITAAGRARMAEAQRRRWAVVKGVEPTATVEAPKKKRQLSPEGRRNIQEALRKRWADKKAAEAKQARRDARGHRGRRMAHSDSIRARSMASSS